MESKIKIAYIIDAINSVAGTEKQLLQLLQCINKEIFEVKLICLRKPSSIFKADRNNFEYIELDIKRILSIKSILGIWRLFRYLRRKEIDIIQTFFFDATIIGVLTARMAGVKRIISSRRDLGFWYTPNLIRVLKVINKMTLRILANSYAVKQHTIKYEKVESRKIDVIRNGIDLNQFEGTLPKKNFRKFYNIPADDFIVGIVANLNRQVKRIDVFINMALEVLKVMPNVSFQIVGNGHLRKKLEKFAKKNDSLNKIMFLGKKEGIYSIIKNWDIGVLSSDSEGFSNSIIEYMSVGLPVVATDVGGNKEIIRADINGILVPPGDYRSMAKKVCSILKNSLKRSRMSANAKKLIEQEYAWNVKIAEIEQYYMRLYDYG